MKPIARQVALICTESGGELTVHDPERQETHHLSPLMTVVYRHADGKTSLSDFVALARAQLRRAVSKEMIVSAMDQLSEAGLLELPPPPAPRLASVA